MTEIHAFDPDGTPSPGATAGVGTIVADAVSTDSAVRAALDKSYRRGHSVEEYGAVGDGIFDATDALQLAADAALAGGGHLYIPAGDWRVARPVDVAAPIQCDGRLIIDSASTGEVRIVRTLAPVTLGVLSGLAEGSMTVGGIGGLTGDLYLTSTEQLIGRNNGTPGQQYVKAELSTVVTEAGEVSPPIAITYDSAASVTATLHPAEPALVIDGLKIVVDGTTGAHPQGIVSLTRSGVTFNDLSVISESSAALTNAVVIRRSSNVEINRGTIRGFTLDGAGYGIARYHTANVRLNDVTVTDCRHCVSGLYNKDTFITRGRYVGGIDDHWHWGLYLTDVTSTVNSGLGHVQGAGRDLVITGGSFAGGRQLVAIRADTPEMAGKLIVRGGWAWAPSPDATVRRIVGYSTTTLPMFGYGRRLKSPDLTIVEDGAVTLPPGGASLEVVRTSGAAFQREHWKRVEIRRVTFPVGRGALAVFYDRGDEGLSGSAVTPQFVMEQMDFTAAGDSVILSDTGEQAGPKIDLTIRDCTGLYLKLPESGLGRVGIERSSVARVFRAAVSATKQPGSISYLDCRMDATQFNGSIWADFIRCVWSGVSSNPTLGLNGMCKSFIGNLVAVTATAPTHPDGYRDPAYYKA